MTSNASNSLELDVLFGDSVEQNYNLDVIRHLTADLKVQLVKKLHQLALFSLSLPLVLPSSQSDPNSAHRDQNRIWSNRSAFTVNPSRNNSAVAFNSCDSYALCNLPPSLTNHTHPTSNSTANVTAGFELFTLPGNDSQYPFDWLDQQLHAIRWQLHFLSSVDLQNRTQLVQLILLLQHVYAPSSSSSLFSSSSSSSAQFDQSPSLNQIARNLFIIVAFLAVVLCSAAGNLLVCITVLRRARHRISRINLLIANLSFSDLFIALFNIPMNISRILLDNWPFGEQLCKLGQSKRKAISFNPKLF
jgi:hypothetical protein